MTLSRPIRRMAFSLFLLAAVNWRGLPAQVETEDSKTTRPSVPQESNRRRARPGRSSTSSSGQTNASPSLPPTAPTAGTPVLSETVASQDPDVLAFLQRAKQAGVAPGEITRAMFAGRFNPPLEALNRTLEGLGRIAEQQGMVGSATPYAYAEPAGRAIWNEWFGSIATLGTVSTVVDGRRVSWNHQDVAVRGIIRSASSIPMGGVLKGAGFYERIPSGSAPRRPKVPPADLTYSHLVELLNRNGKTNLIPMADEEILRWYPSRCAADYFPLFPNNYRVLRHDFEELQLQSPVAVARALDLPPDIRAWLDLLQAAAPLDRAGRLSCVTHLQFRVQASAGEEQPVDQDTLRKAAAVALREFGIHLTPKSPAVLVVTVNLTEGRLRKTQGGQERSSEPWYSLGVRVRLETSAAVLTPEGFQHRVGALLQQNSFEAKPRTCDSGGIARAVSDTVRLMFSSPPREPSVSGDKALRSQIGTNPETAIQLHESHRTALASPPQETGSGLTENSGIRRVGTVGPFESESLPSREEVIHAWNDGLEERRIPTGRPSGPDIVYELFVAQHPRNTSPALGARAWTVGYHVTSLEYPYAFVRLNGRLWRTPLVTQVESAEEMDRWDVFALQFSRQMHRAIQKLTSTFPKIPRP